MIKGIIKYSIIIIITIFLLIFCVSNTCSSYSDDTGNIYSALLKTQNNVIIGSVLLKQSDKYVKIYGTIGNIKNGIYHIELQSSTPYILNNTNIITNMDINNVFYEIGTIKVSGDKNFFKFINKLNNINFDKNINIVIKDNNNKIIAWGLLSI